jgi:cysteine-rich repeat protein
MFRASLFALATLSLVTCTVDTQQTGSTPQSVITRPPPSNLNLALYARTRVTIGSFAQVIGDVGSSGSDGSVLFDFGASQPPSGNVLANTVEVSSVASVGHVFGNDLAIIGFAVQQTLGLDLAALPPVPAVTPAVPGTTNVSVAANHTTQLCPGQYGTISLARNSTLNLNGGVYHLSGLTLADGARLEPSEPVVILVSGSMTTGGGAIIAPFPEVVNPMSSADIRIEVGGSVSIGGSSQVRAHLLVPDGSLATGTGTSLIGAAWAGRIDIGSQSVIIGDGVFSAQAPSVPPPCNDNDVCTIDQCVSVGTTAFCRNTPVSPEVCNANRCGNGIVEPGEECDDGNVIDGDGCSSTCTLPRCGNGIVEPGEECDDGNVIDGDGCSSICTLPRCGNGIVEPGEECDDGNTTEGDGCSNSCTLPRCGNGALDPGEELDPPPGPSQVVPVNDQTCRFDFSAITQLYCNGSCGTWGSSEGGCQQGDADAFCKLKTGNPSSSATSFVVGVASAAPGICCPTISGLGCTELGVLTDRGVLERVSVHETDLLSTHGPGAVITDVVCTP